MKIPGVKEIEYVPLKEETRRHESRKQVWNEILMFLAISFLVVLAAYITAPLL